MKVAIFGGNGYIGRHLAVYLQKDGIVTDLYDIQDECKLSDVKYRKCDILKPEFWATFLPEEYDAIYYFAGLSGPEKSFVNATGYVEVNEVGLLNFLNKVSQGEGKFPRIVFPSSRLVYRGGGVVVEDSPIEARSVYAANKIACEGLLSAYYHRYGIPYVALRICVPYGNMISKEYSYGTLGFFIGQALSGFPISVYGDGQCCKTYTHIGDLCEILKRVATMTVASGVYNVGGHEYTLKQVATLVAQATNGRLEYIQWPDAAARVEMGDITLNATKLANAIGYIEYKKLEEYVKDL